MQVHWVSAHEALLGRLYLRGKLTSAQMLQLHNRTFPCQDLYDVPKEKYAQAASKLLQQSGVPNMEQVHRLGLLLKMTGI